MKNVRSRTVVLLFLLALGGLTPPASSQVNPQRGGQRQRLELERRLQQGFERSVQTQLGLDAETTEAVRRTMQSFQGERSELNRAQASLRHRLRDPALPDIGSEEAQALLQEMVDLQERELALYRREQAELLEIMTPIQVLRFYRLRENFGQRLNQLRQRRGQGGGLGGGVGAGLPPDGGFPLGGSGLR